MSAPIVLQAPAKLNLGLLVTGRRPDGYHNLVSVFQTVDWEDTLEVLESPSGIEVECSGGSSPTGRGNLAFRAAELALDRFSIARGVGIRLQKAIPVGAGLGGGSSDAAATLRGVRRLFSLGGSEEDWLELCGKLGSDVPFFWRGGTALVQGRGEKITPIQTSQNLWFVVAVPPVQVSTAWAYARLREPFSDPSDYLQRAMLLGSGKPSFLDFCRKIQNDFEPAIEEAFPRIRETRQILEASGPVCARMSGSGSAVFAVYAHEQQARKATQSLPYDCIARCVRGIPSFSESQG